MVHKLRIDLEYDYKNEHFADLLTHGEFVRGDVVIFKVNITNLGDTPFYGTLKLVSCLLGVEKATGVMTQAEPNLKIDGIQPNERKMVYRASFVMIMETQGSIKCKVEADDGERIEYYQQKIPLIGDEWEYPFRVANKEQLITIKLLSEIREKLNNISK